MSLNFKVRGPNSPNPVSIVAPATLTWGEFLELLQTELKINDEFDVLCGFPATVATYSNDQIIGAVFQSNESLRVQLKAVAGQQAQGQSKQKPVKKGAKTAQQNAVTGSFGAKIAGIKQQSSQRSFLASSPAKRPLTSSTTSAEPATKRRRKSSAASKISSEGDIAEHLISAVSGGTGAQNRIARKVFRNAVQHQYNSTQAVSRVNAIYSGQYTIRECGGVLLSSSSSSGRPIHTHIEVTYHKGAGSRGVHVDTVELLSKELLLGVLKVAVQGDDANADDDAGGGREALKPMNLSRCSPRIFWSMVHHYGADLVNGIRTALKGVDDCAWLDERKRELSEKAKANQQQLEEQQARKGKGAVKKKATTAGETGSPGATTVDVTPTTGSSSSCGVGLPSASSSSAEPAVPERTPLQQWVLQQVCDHLALGDFVPADWLPSVQQLLAGKALGASVGGLAALVVSSKLRDELVAIHSTKRASASNLPVDQVESWIVGARVSVFHCIWRVVCGGGSERLRSALYKFGVRKPRDFRMWRNAPEGLLQGLVQRDDGLTTEVRYSWSNEAPVDSELRTTVGSGDGGTGSGLTKERLAWMSQVALTASQVLPFIDSDGLGDSAGEQDDGDDAEEGEEGSAAGEEQEEALPWQYDPPAHQHMQRRVRLEVDNGYWEDGTVVAYLPPEPDEPMALWRVKLDSALGRGAVGDSEKERFEDLEEHEVEEAIRRAMT